MSNQYTYEPPCSRAGLEMLYHEMELTQSEIAEQLNVSQKVIWRAMQYFEIPARKAAARDQKGTANNNWKGDDAGYQAFHIRVEVARGTPSLCEECGTSDPSKSYDWTNISGNYEDVADYRRLCRSCHWKDDKTIFNIHHMKEYLGAREAA